MRFLHWLIQTENPIRIYGFWPVFVWLAWAGITLGGFFFLETFGLKRFHESIPLTWLVRCGPRIAGFVFFGWAIWHFLFVNTKP